jgi:hypothetical protein
VRECCVVRVECAEEGSEGDARVEARGIEVVVRFENRVIVVWNEEWEKRFGEKRGLECCHGFCVFLPSLGCEGRRRCT